MSKIVSHPVGRRRISDFGFYMFDICTYFVFLGSKQMNYTVLTNIVQFNTLKMRVFLLLFLSFYLTSSVFPAILGSV
jgi:hypothetical protein